mmetsp:Transcript_8158/g.30100  ORF Transcript_8158/g.30100 Transcript_8158/m.30100 type:complete len:632 (+) Transcript_8158:183-2078(+)
MPKSKVSKGLLTTCRSRLLEEVLGGNDDWKVLVLDSFTIGLVNSCCRVSDVLEQNVSLIETLEKSREPLPAQDAVYLISPTRESVELLVRDFSNERRPMYSSASVYFTSSLGDRLISRIKASAPTISRLKALKELNFEFVPWDEIMFSTDSKQAFYSVYGPSRNTAKGEIAMMARRLGTVFATLGEMPEIRYRAPPETEELLPLRETITEDLATELLDVMRRLAKTTETVPKKPTCELLILERSFDPVAPVIHEWTYEAMVHDILDVKGKMYTYEFETNRGGMEEKHVLLDEHDLVWLELRHVHFAEASMTLDAKMRKFSESKGAKLASKGKRGDGAPSTRELKNLVQALPQFREELAKLSLHVDIVSSLSGRLVADKLKELGELEQKLVLGEATGKEIISLINSSHNVFSREDKMRLLMCYVSTHPEKLDSSKRSMWTKIAALSNNDLNTIMNLENLGVAVSKTSGSKSFFKRRKDKEKALRKVAKAEAEWELARFQPEIQALIESMAAGALPGEEYSSLNADRPADRGSVKSHGSKKYSARSMRTSSWATKASDDPKVASSLADMHLSGKRLFVFVIGGVTFSEKRVAYKLSSELQREVIIGGTSVITPASFLEQLEGLSEEFNEEDDF